MERSCLISTNKEYRWSLSFKINKSKKEIIFIGLNPSLSDLNYIDNTTRKIIKICKGKYSSAEIFINLVNIRRFNIQVFGPGLEKNGYLTVSPIDRLSYVYRSIQDVSDLKYSIRDVEIIRDNQTFKYDLLNYFVAGQEASNPYLNQNDKVRLKIVDETISISGAINIQQDLEFHIDDSYAKDSYDESKPWFKYIENNMVYCEDH